jgi:hypothetical protein
MAILLNPACDSCTCTNLQPVKRAWISGYFNNIGGIARTGLALIDENALGVTAFDAGITDTCYCILRDEDNGTVWTGGQFITVHGVSCRYLVAVDEDTGATVFNCDLSGSETGPGFIGSVENLVMDATYVYAAGNWLTVGGVTQSYLARFSRTTGAFDSTWTPVVDRPCYGLRLHGGTLYICGFFTTVNGVSRDLGFANVDLVTGTTMGSYAPSKAGFGGFGVGGGGDILFRGTNSAVITGVFASSSFAPTLGRLATTSLTGAQTTVFSGSPPIEYTAFPGTGDGRCLVGYDGLSFFVSGNFSLAGGHVTYGVAKFLYAGVVDTTFTTLLGDLSDWVDVGPDGRVYAGTSNANGSLLVLNALDGSSYTDWLPAPDRRVTGMAFATD